MVHTTTIAVANVVANLNAAENAVAIKPTKETVPSNRYLNRIFLSGPMSKFSAWAFLCLHKFAN